MVTHRVALIRRVLAAVDLDDQSPLAAGEIGHVGSDWILANELGAAELPRAQAVPQSSLDIGRVVAKPTGAAGLCRVCVTHCAYLRRSDSRRRPLTPTLSPHAGRGGAGAVPMNFAGVCIDISLRQVEDAAGDDVALDLGGAAVDRRAPHLQERGRDVDGAELGHEGMGDRGIAAGGFEQQVVERL
jgi:hypothetical protein